MKIIAAAALVALSVVPVFAKDLTVSEQARLELARDMCGFNALIDSHALATSESEAFRRDPTRYKKEFEYAMIRESALTAAMEKYELTEHCREVREFARSNGFLKR